MRRGFTLVELLIIITLLAIAAGLALPTLGDASQLRLREAARLLAADIEFAQSESIGHGDAPRAIVFDPANRKYWIAPRVMADPSQAPDEADAVADPVPKTPFVVTFPAGSNPGDRSGRASGLGGVTIQAAQNMVTDDALRFLPFDAYGTPLDETGQPSSAIAAVTLAAGASTLTIQVAPGSGEVTIP
jgi:prepilin-type N-terminal cleavage/methylation domain-containing protein